MPEIGVKLPTNRFADLFAGRTDAWGTGSGPVEKGTLTIDHYADHLAGEGSGLGIFPMRDDNTVRFAAIDLDEPNFELAQTMRKLLPGIAWIERSRSGNAHIWVFFDGDCPAWAARAVLSGATEAVGRRDVEIFPKQDALRGEGSVGNYINLPYHGGDRKMIDYFQTLDGGIMPRPEGVERPGFWADVELEGFLSAVPDQLHDPDAWVRRARNLGAVAPEEREAAGEWGESPVLHMCADKIITERHENPILPGARNRVLFLLAVQLLNYRDFNEDESWHWLNEVNDAGPKPLGENELRRLFDNARDGRFTFTGCDDPLMAPYVHPDCKIAQGEAGR